MMVRNVVRLFGLFLSFWVVILPARMDAAMVARWVADDWVGGQNAWIDRVDGVSIYSPGSSANPTKTAGGFPLRGVNVSSGLAFDGIFNYMYIGVPNHPIAGKDQVTIVVLFRTNQGASGVDEFFWQYPGPLTAESGGSENDWGLTYDSAGNAQGFFNDPITPAPPVNVTDGIPHTMILTWQDPSVFPGAGIARLYVDGMLVGSTGPTDGGDGIVSDTVYIGSEFSRTRYFKGMIGELRFYDSVEDPVLLHDEIMAYVEAQLVVSGTYDKGAGSLRQTITDAPPGSTVTFSPALSGMTIKLEGTQILINKNLTIDASALPGGITISGQHTTRVFEIEAGVAVNMKGLVIRDGAIQDGGGIYNRGDLTLEGCRLSGNAATRNGGGLYVKDGTLSMFDCTVADNTADVLGGGVFLTNATANVTGSTCTSNAAGASGGGMCNSGGLLTVNNSTIADNTALQAGGGLSNEAGSLGSTQVLRVANSTMVGNAAAYGSGVYNAGILHLENNIVAANVPSTSLGGDDIYNDGGTIMASGANLIGNNDTVLAEFPAGTLVGTATQPLDPFLAPLGDYGGPTHTRPPLPDSPVIDVASSGPATDQRGVPRVQGDAYDLGAVEIESRQVTDLADNGPGTLRQAIAELSPFGTVSFASGLNGGTITLGTGQILIDRSLNIDASGLSRGMTISGNNASRVFEIAGGASVMMDSLTIAGGRTPDGASGTIGAAGSDSRPGGQGGTGESAQPGGGILNRGGLTLRRLTLSGNSTGKGGKGGDGGPGVLQGTGGRGGTGGAGGAIYNADAATLRMENCTIANNTNGQGGNGGSGTTRGDGGNGGSGGGVCNQGVLYLYHCTLAGNACGSGGSGELGLGPGGAGGGIVNNSPFLTMVNSTVALNTAPGGKPDLAGPVSFFYGGVNFVGNTSGAGNLGTVGIDYLTGDPKLESLGHYGGPTQSRPPRPGSPVINAAIIQPHITTDQRGVPRLAGIWRNDFSHNLSGATVLASGGNPATGTLNAGSFRFTPEAANQRASLVLPDLGGFNGFSVGFNLYFSDGDDPAGPAEGFSLSFGPAPGAAVGEEGVAGAHVVRIDTYENDPDLGFFRYIRNTGNPTNITSNFSFHRIQDANTWHHIDITLLNRGRLTVNANGFTFLDDIDTGYSYSPGDRFTLGAGTGSLVSEQRVDNIDVQVYLPDIGAIEGAFVPAGPFRLTRMYAGGNTAIQMSWTNHVGSIFNVLASPAVDLPEDAWFSLGYAVESPSGSGQFQFADPQSRDFPKRFYRIQSP